MDSHQICLCFTNIYISKIYHHFQSFLHIWVLVLKFSVFFDISLLETGLTSLTAELWGRQAVFLSNGSIDKRNLNSVDSKQEKQNGSCKNVHFSNKDMNSNNNNSSAALSRFLFFETFSQSILYFAMRRQETRCEILKHFFS